MVASAAEEIPGAIAGFYVGALVENASIGRECSVQTFSSRYTAEAQGVTMRGRENYRSGAKQAAAATPSTSGGEGFWDSGDSNILMDAE